MYKLFIYITFGAIFLTGMACSGDDDGDDDKDPASSPDDGTGGTIGFEVGASGEGGSSGTSGVEKPATCGNGIVEVDMHEECDDGNTNDDDGCTNLCEFTCTDDEECDDLDPCNGKEMCLDDHTCAPVTEALSDGEPCGDNAWCHDGKCVGSVCGDGIKQGDEECDDGNNVDSDGCTKECLFTCVATRDLETIVNDCNPDAVCNETTHKWEGGVPLPDGTFCRRGEGYCQDGLCILSTCGDGIQEPNEDCDLGEQNGAQNSGCTATCTTTVCGNGVIEGEEMCDDGNNVNIDGCDYKCIPEATYRGSALRISMEPAPDYCIHAGNEHNGNAFSKLFADQALVDLVNDFIQGAFDDGEIHSLFHAMDMEGYEPTKPDPLARLGLSMGEPLQDWMSVRDTIDPEFYTYREFFDDNLQPLSTVPGEMVIENGRQVTRSTAPTVAGFHILGMEFVLHDMMARIETDNNLTPLTPPPDTVEGLVVHSSVGAHGTGNPTGVLCGALHQDAFASMPLPPALLVLCLDQLGQGILGTEDALNPCDEGEDFSAGECDSILTWFQTGCSNGLDTITFLNPLGEPDVDTDGDGTPDAYTSVLRVSAQRVKVVGVTDMPEDFGEGIL